MKVRCPQCHGKGEVTCTQVDAFSDEIISQYEIGCPTCDGAKEVDSATAEQHAREQEMWCECDDVVAQTFYPDGAHAEIHKHHYRCDSCDKVTQIG